MNTDLNLYQFMISVSFWTGALMLLIGLFILISPDLFIRTGNKLNRWVSTEAFFNKLDAPKNTERFFYRHHISFGLLFVFGAMYIFYTFAFAFDASKQTLSFFSSAVVNDWLISSLVFSNLIFSVVIFVIGIFMMLRPSALKNIEVIANHWFAVDESLKGLDVQLGAPDKIFSKRPRLLGFIIMVGSAYICMNLWAMM